LPILTLSKTSYVIVVDADDEDDDDEEEEDEDGDDELLLVCCSMDTADELLTQNCCNAFLTLSNKIGSFDCRSFCSTRWKPISFNLNWRSSEPSSLLKTRFETHKTAADCNSIWLWLFKIKFDSKWCIWVLGLLRMCKMKSC
jgi:hypothetical protein